ncbi:type III-B CRISPR-associated protein Cas10/Cmr2 [Alysiella filiformis]|uniref:CRISPR-associated protein Cmr2 n=1 Tax=Alysiella filiformis DSM 16848 TaxID=1120981 RepID=A0A286EDA8_9NEIS|nr:type III-B CRISPR-associated protein Cas10/Cmr2 [Alysiella filiformis]QMT31182.1 type III-B CRISPR-associated protein Cas10/Cmr2 [Alysiella filiformis]UBQ55823.1 type III-B CRISPR-associated protein Cas10/Cmr2 [Alysiella filiformis DSM 16848]SOD68888.1 CRISPR-associated protein Cmr2 [Alysiella filiformis DSM 16848]
MNSYVLTFTIGPVQGFIASARRSRDLWAGSWLLSELAKAVAKNLHDKGAELIFPYVENPDDLQPESEFSVGNKIQVVVQAENAAQLTEIANQAKAATNAHFIQIADKVWDNLSHYHNDLRQEIWEKQKNDYVEVQYAWARISNDNGDNKAYLNASQKAAQLLAARKATRDFTQQTGDFLPKSSLDGARETVLLEEKNISKTLRNKLGLSQSEQLDCVGVVKRLCGTPEQFTPITRVAADDWLNEIKVHENFALVKKAYKSLVESELATRVLGNKGIYDDFPYDAQFCYSSRLNAALVKADEKTYRLLIDLQAALKPIWREFGEPCPYFAMLLADGDRMGELLDKAETQENHQDISQNLSVFAQFVPKIMRENRAQYIYAGGDDVLGLASLNNAVKSAKMLKDQFSDSLKTISAQLGAETPTLSVGLAICHIQNPLGNIRSLAKRAEKIAKGDNAPQPRNALGITLAVRSGSISDMRWRWDDKKAQRYFKYWIKCYKSHKLSSRVAYDCRDIFMRTDFPPNEMNEKEQADLLGKIRFAEMKRMLDKAQTSLGKPLDKITKAILMCRFDALNGDLNALATELIIARWLAAKTQRDLGRENG